MVLISNISVARMVCFGFFVFHTSFSIVDDHNLDIFQTSPVLDTPDPALLLSDMNWNDDQTSDIFSDIGSSDILANSIPFDDSTTLLADCGATGNNNPYRKNRKARFRRDGNEAICNLSAPLPALSLPTLDQAFPADTNENDAPKKKGLRVPQDWLVYTRLGLAYGDLYLQCSFDPRICSSEDEADIKSDGSGLTYTVEHAQSSEFFSPHAFSLSLSLSRSSPGV